MITLIFDTKTGVIQNTLNGKLNKAQSDAMKASGTGVLETELDIDGHSGMVDLETMKPVKFTKPEAPIADPFIQLVAALIKSGTVSEEHFHPRTVAEIDGILDQCKMGKIRQGKKTVKE